MPLTRLKSPQAAARWLGSWVTGTLRTDSRQVGPGDAFIAWPGYATDGRRFVVSALQAGASTCLVEAEGIEAFGFDDARIAALPGLKAATGAAAGVLDSDAEILMLQAVRLREETLRAARAESRRAKYHGTWAPAQRIGPTGPAAGA